MAVLDNSAIRSAPLHSDPFDYLVVPDCVTNEKLTPINADYPDITVPGNKSLEDLTFGEAFETLIHELTGPEFAEVIGEKFGVDLTESPTTITVRKFCEKSDGNIHTDHPSKVITVLLYFNQGWTRPEGQLRLLRSNADIEDYAAEVVPLGGTLLAFRRTDHSWHGHKPFVGERRMLQVNFLRASPSALLKQRIDRLGTRTMKKALRLLGTGN